MDEAEISSRLAQLKALVWVQSFFGVALVLGLFWFLLWRPDVDNLIPGTLLCGMLWTLGLGPLGRRARRLASEPRQAPTGLPSWVLVLLGAGQFASLSFWSTEWAPFVLPAYLLVGGAIVLRGFLSWSMDLPVHGRTWGVTLSLLAFGSLLNLFACWAVMMGC